MSVKDALTLIPKFDGKNIQVSTFVRGLRMTKNIIPAHLESSFVKVLIFRLSSEALRSVEGLTFFSIQEMDNHAKWLTM